MHFSTATATAPTCYDAGGVAAEHAEAQHALLPHVCRLCCMLKLRLRLPQAVLAGDDRAWLGGKRGLLRYPVLRKLLLHLCHCLRPLSGHLPAAKLPPAGHLAVQPHKASAAAYGVQHPAGLTRGWGKGIEEGGAAR